MQLIAPMTPTASRVCVVGSYNRDLVFSLALNLPLPGETVPASLSHSHGGKGSNQAAACARAGSETCFICSLGRDDVGVAAKAFLDDLGVAVCAFTDHAQPTGCAAIAISAAQNGENTILLAPGANAVLPLNFTVDAVTKFFSPRTNNSARSSTPPNVCIAQLETPLSVVAAALTAAHSAPSPAATILNPAPAAALASLGPSALPQWLRDASIDFLTPNEVELEQILDALPAAEEPPATFSPFPPTATLPIPNATVAAVRRRLLAPMLVRVAVIVTLGNQGAVIVTTDDAAHVPAFKVDSVLSTVGAGDCFNGYLASTLPALPCPIADIATAARVACVAASLSVTKQGAAESIPTLAEVTAAMAST
jgi:ribokinase